MEWLTVTFPVSGVQTWLWLPPLVAFVISFFSSMVGISGAFLLLPFQMSVLNFASPAASSTNLVFNLVAIPSGVWRYIKEGRMAWPLTWVVVIGTLPGIFIGYRLLSEFAPWKIKTRSKLGEKFTPPVYTVAGAALAGTLVTSVVGVIAYSVLPPPSRAPSQPDWAWGPLFGIGA